MFQIEKWDTSTKVCGIPEIRQCIPDLKVRKIFLPSLSFVLWIFLNLGFESLVDVKEPIGWCEATVIADCEPSNRSDYNRSAEAAWQK